MKRVPRRLERSCLIVSLEEGESPLRLGGLIPGGKAIMPGGGFALSTGRVGSPDLVGSTTATATMPVHLIPVGMSHSLLDGVQIQQEPRDLVLFYQLPCQTRSPLQLQQVVPKKCQ